MGVSSYVVAFARHLYRSEVRAAPQLLWGCIGVMLLGCGGDGTGPAPQPTTELFWALPLNWHAINLALQAPYDTVQLTASPRTVAGTVLAGTGAVQYTAADSTVSVSSTGLVTAHYITSRTTVVARLTVGSVTLADTAVVQVVGSAPSAPLATFSIQPRPDGLAQASAYLDDQTYVGTMIPVYATLTTEDPVTNLLISYGSSDSTVSGIDQSGYIVPQRPGRVTFYASTLAYGVAKQDSLPFSIGYNSLIQISLHARGRGDSTGLYAEQPSGSQVVGAGGRVVINNYASEKVEMVLPYQTSTISNLTVADPHHLIDTLAADNDYRFIRFDSAGTYAIRFRLLGTGGIFDYTLMVKSDP